MGREARLARALRRAERRYERRLRGYHRDRLEDAPQDTEP